MPEDDQVQHPSIIEHDLAGRHGPFAHQSEAEFGRILNFYQIDWEYEPRSFPLVWDVHGHVRQYFTPDFYLPEFDLYIELTTLRQSLVTKKNRKLRRLRELYPDVHIKLFYRKDIHSLMRKYGIPLPPNGIPSNPEPDVEPNGQSDRSAAT